MLARVHVEPDVLVRAAVAEPPMDVRLTVTDERLELVSETEHVRVVVLEPSDIREAGEKEQEAISGGTL